MFTRGSKTYMGYHMTVKVDGQLEVDIRRGVLYFHSNKTGTTLLRICGLKDELRTFNDKTQLDITHRGDIVMISKLME